MKGMKKPNQFSSGRFGLHALCFSPEANIPLIPFILAHVFFFTFSLTFIISYI